jgi:hypothetical protein
MVNLGEKLKAKSIMKIKLTIYMVELITLKIFKTLMIKFLIRFLKLMDIYVMNNRKKLRFKEF